MKEEKKLHKKRAIGVLAVSLLVAGSAFLAAGCGDSSTGAADTATQTTQAQNQAAGQGGMSTTEPDLTGVPVYPGAEKEAMTMGGPGRSGTSGSNTGTPPTPPSGTMPSMSMVRYTTSDSVDTVATWYRGQLSSLDGFTESTGTFGPQGATQTVFAFDNGGTTITIMIGEGMPGQDGTSGGTSISYTEGEMPSPPSS